MTNPYYNVTGAPPAQNRGASASIRNEFTLIQTGFDALVSNFAAKGNVSGQTWTGTHNFPSTTYGVTATAGSNNTLLSTTEYVDRAISVLPAGTLPSVTGKDTTWSLTPNATGTGVQWTQGAGSGGTAITGNVTLTSASAAAMTVTPTTYGLYATLPNATTLPKDLSIFSFYNAGDYDYGLKDSAGTQLGWIRPKTGALLGLSDNSTAAGSWVLYGVEKLGLTLQYVNTALSNNGGGILRVALDANRTCFIFGGTDCYGIVYDASTQTWGSATLIRAGVNFGTYKAVLSAVNQVLVVSCNSTTGLQGVALTISSNTITVNTAASVVLAGNISSLGQLIAVSTSFVVSYGRATTAAAIRAITISGTTVTIGAESALDTTLDSSANLYASGSIVRCIYQTSAFTVTAKPYTVSGSTLTVGTAATAIGTATGVRSFLNGNGNIVAEYNNTTHFATIFKLTGTTEAESSVSLGTASTSIQQYNDYAVISNSKTLFTSIVTGITWYANILTDTSGTATSGTQISGPFANGLQTGLVPIYSSSNIVRAFSRSTGNLYLVTFDCSGSSPVLSASVSLATNNSQFYSSPCSNLQGIKDYSLLISGNHAVSLGAVGSGGSNYGGQSLRLSSTIQPIQSIPSAANPLNAGVGGASNSETFLSYQYTNNNGLVISKLELAA